jgi:hypothetical protein
MKHAGIAVPKLDMESVSQAPEKPPMPLCEVSSMSSTRRLLLCATQIRTYLILYSERCQYELAGKKMDELFVQVKQLPILFLS